MSILNHRKIWFLVFLLLVPSLSAYTPTIEAQADYWVHIELEEVYGLRGESINITSTTNYAGSNVRIYDPNDSLIYDQDWTANDTRAIPISDTATYGTYRIVGRVPNTRTETWFTVLDITNWDTVTSWPHIVDHHGLEYSFYKNWTVGVRQHGDSLLIDFSTIRKLAKAYNMDINPRNNSMNFRLRFSKGPNVIDLNFAFIHVGAKIIINGTLDHGRDISINIEGEEIKKWINSLSTGNIVFDWSDVLGGEWWVYLPEERELIIHAPQTFRIDPVIFSDGFEGSDGDWTGIFGSPDLNSTVYVHHGTESMEANISAWGEGGCYKSIGDQGQTTFTRWNQRIETVPSTNQQCVIHSLRNGGSANQLYTLIIIDDSGTMKLRLRYEYPSQTEVDYTFTFSASTWYCFEVKTTISNSTGEHRVYLEGEEVITVTGLDNEPPSYPYPDYFYYGLISHSPYNDYALISYVDCVVIDDEYIGPEITGTLIDSYTEGNQSGNYALKAVHPSGNIYESASGQSFNFSGSNYNITCVQFYTQTDGNPNGTIRAKLYAHTGTMGSSSLPTGSPLATSEPYYIDNIGASYRLITLFFNDSQQYEMVSGTEYCIDIEVQSGSDVDSSNGIDVGLDFTSPSHVGNSFAYDSGGWFHSSGIYDLIFYVYGDEIVGGDSTPPTYSNPNTNTTVAGDPCQFQVTLEDETALDYYIFGTNNTGTWVNETEVDISGTSYVMNETKTLNSSIGVRVEWQVWFNDTSDNWNNTGIQFLITTSGDVTPPTYSNPNTNTTDAGDPCRFQVTLEDETALDYFIFGTNNTGSWVNDTAVDISGLSYIMNVTKTLNSTVGVRVEWRAWFNDTSDNWNNTGIQFLITIDDALPTYSNPNTNTTVAGNPCRFQVTLEDETALDYYIFGTNNTGTWVNETEVDISGTSYIMNETKTLNASVGVRVEWQVWFNDTANNWNNTGIQFLITTSDVTPPTYSNPNTDTTMADDPCRFQVTLEDETALDYYIFGTNNTGTWVNDTAVDISGLSYIMNVTKTLNSTIGIRVEWRVWFNDTSNNWNNTGIQFLITTSGHIFNLRTINSTEGGIENARVILENSTDTIFNLLTNSTGFIAQQSLDSGNYTLTITREGYMTYEHEIEITQDLYLIVRIFTLDEGAQGGTNLLYLFGLVFVGIIIMTASRKR